MASSKFRVPAPSEQDLLNGVQLRLLDPDDGLERERFRDLMTKHHYLKSDTMVGEQLRYVAEVDGKWVAETSTRCAGALLQLRPSPTVGRSVRSDSAAGRPAGA